MKKLLVSSCIECPHRDENIGQRGYCRDAGFVIPDPEAIPDFCQLANEPDWHTWDMNNPPTNDEISFVAFRNELNGMRWVQVGAVVTGMFWYDSVPTHYQGPEAWPQLPEDV